MRGMIIALAAAALLAACSKPASDANKPADAAKPGATPTAAAPTAAPPPAPTAAPVSGPPVAGRYTANGKQAALAYVIAMPDEPFDDQPVIQLIFTAQDPKGDPKADFNALFGKYGDAIIAKVQPDGSVIGSNIVHAGLQHSGVSMAGVLSVKDYRNAGGEISGRLTTGGPHDVFGEPLDIDLTFHTKAPG